METYRSVVIGLPIATALLDPQGKAAGIAGHSALEPPISHPPNNIYPSTRGNCGALMLS